MTSCKPSEKYPQRKEFKIAVDGFGHNELPVREGWALVRLARLSDKPEPLLQAARHRFERSDLAAGILPSIPLQARLVPVWIV